MAKRYHQAVLVSCEVPWSEKEELLEDLFRKEVRSTLSNFNNLYIFGTAGEGYAVTVSRFEEIVRIFREETDLDGVYPMVGVIAMSTPQVVERVGLAFDMGFRVFQIAMPLEIVFGFHRSDGTRSASRAITRCWRVFPNVTISISSTPTGRFHGSRNRSWGRRITGGRSRPP